MRSPYEEYAVAASKNVGEETAASKNSAIPYHARENSLPFSYGQIGKTSTPLRNGSRASASAGAGGGTYRNYNANATSGADVGLDFDIDANFNLNSERYYGNTSNYKTTMPTSTVGGGSGGNGVGADANMIKTQPRLTSPLLVRKTLNSSRSPTRGSSNTIANTYHYNYKNSSSTNNNNNSNYGNDSGYGNGTGGAFGTNGNINSYSSSSTNNNNNNISSGVGGGTLRKMPARSDFEELLRERRERVYNEYRPTTHDFQATKPQPQPAPPPRQYLPTATRIRNGQSQKPSKYNYDFEFNLNLDDLPPPTRYANTVDRSSLQYRTRDIPVARDGGGNVERNYHTISSSNAYRETLSSAYAGERERPPLEATYNQRRFESQQLLQPPQRRPEYAAFGSGNASGYGYNYHSQSSNEYGSSRASLGAVRSRNEMSSPIYATSTKQRATYQHQRSANEPELSITDYPSSSTMAAATSTSTLYGTRPETPAFPVTPRTPYGALNGHSSPIGYAPSFATQRLDYTQPQTPDVHNYSTETIYQTQPRPRLQSNMSLLNSEPQEVAAHLVKFAKDSSKFWYKPNLSREEAISLLLNAPPGTFIVRDSTTYKQAFGLVLRVAQPPPGSASGRPDELVRHFLIEPTTRGVRLKGCANEPVFTSLSALVYEHSINQMALPCLLRIPDHDLVPPLLEPTPAQKQLLTQGAACNVMWLYSCDTESLTGEEAIRKAIRQLYAQQPLPAPTEVHFKVSQQGITLTDNTRKKFFRKHYAADIISYCAIDPDHRLWAMQEGNAEGDKNSAVGAFKKTIFAFVARRSASSKDNQCHVFCDLSISQPASAIVSFVNKTLPTEKQRNYIL